MSERLTARYLQVIQSGLAHATTVDPRNLILHDMGRLLDEVLRLRAVLVRGVEAEEDLMHPGAKESWAALTSEAALIRKESAS